MKLGNAVLLALVACRSVPAAERAGSAGSAVAAPAPDATAPEPVDVAPAGRWSRAEVEADVALLRDVLGTLHPGLARYLDAAALDAAYARLTDELVAARDAGAGFVALSRFTAAIRCGHTFPNPRNQSDEVRAALEGNRRLPLLFRWLDGAPVVVRDLGGALPAGTRIERLGGVAASEVLAALLTIARADGSNDAKRVATLDVLGAEDDEAFDLYYPLLFGLGSTLALDVVLPDGSRRAVEVATLTASERRAAIGPAIDVPEPSAAWTLRPVAPGVMAVAMPTWVMYHGKRDWKADVDALFAALVRRKARALIVDLRGNEGGDDVGNAILQHLVARPLALEGLERRVRYQSVPAALRPALDTWDPSFFDWGDDAEPREGGWFHLRGESGAETLAPRAPRFTGRVLVLVDAANSSATFQFAQHVQRHRLATLIGQPTGGNQRGINGGAFFFLRLPHLGFEVDVPLIARYPRDGNLDALPDAGLTPDVVVPLTAADVAAGRDPVLAEAIARARR